MKSKHCFQRFTAALACLMLCVLCMPHAALAKGYNVLPVEQDCSLALNYHLNGSGVADIEYTIYQVAEMNGNVQLTLTQQFKDCDALAGADVSDLCGSLGITWARLAESLANYCADMDAADSNTTDTDGVVEFTGLPMGLYLVTGSRHADPANSDIYYRPAPFLVALPSWVEREENVEDWAYDVTVTSKPMQSLTPGRVLKIWDDGEDRSVEHDPIQVQLLKNGTAYGAPVTLSAANNWRFDFTQMESELDDTATWALQEIDAPENYTVNISQQGITFVVTNTYTAPVTPPPAPLEPTEPTPSPRPSSSPVPSPSIDPVTPPEEVEDPNVPMADLPTLEEIEEPDVPLSQPDPVPEEVEDPDVPMANLPQTGQLWWPVPILAVAGMVMFLFGLKRRSGANYEK